MSGLGLPEETVDWSEVELAALIRERDSLRLQIEVDSDVLFVQRQDIEGLTGERDRARALAVRLEQELAEVTEWRDAWRTAALANVATEGETP